MKLKSFNYFIGLLIIFFIHLLSEEKIDIWKNKKEITKESQNQKKKNPENKLNISRL